MGKSFLVDQISVDKKDVMSFSYLNLLLLTRFVALMFVLLLLTIMVCFGLAVLVVCAENLGEQEKQKEKNIHKSSGSTAPPGNPPQCIV